MTTVRHGAVLTLLLAASAGTASAGGLAGSLSSMRQQHGVALREQYEFMANQRQVSALVGEGRLVRLDGNGDYVVNAQVAYPFARAEVRQLIEHVAARYHAATGQRLVVTSLVRPQAEQPSNAHRLSVHPAGMAVDLRVPADARARAELERTLLGLEKEGVLDVTREFRPPHYHVAVFPSGWRELATRLEAADAARAVEVAEEAKAREAAAQAAVFSTVPTGFAAVTFPAASAGSLDADVRTRGSAAAFLFGIALTLGAATVARYRVA